MPPTFRLRSLSPSITSISKSVRKCASFCANKDLSSNKIEIFIFSETFPVKACASPSKVRTAGSGKHCFSADEPSRPRAKCGSAFGQWKRGGSAGFADNHHVNHP